MIDFHCHLLPAIDDGPETIDESVAMAAALHKAGFNKIYCTPHLMKGCYDADNRTVLSAVISLQKKLNKENIKIEVLPGREYYLDEFLGQHLKHPLPLGKTKYIMVEVPNYADGEYVKEACFRIKCSGFIPMIAHPERCRIFALSAGGKKSFFGFGKKNDSGAKSMADGLIKYLKEIGCAFQGNIGSLDGLYGKEVQQTAKFMKTKKWFTHYGTDAHSLEGITNYFTRHKFIPAHFKLQSPD
jgi:protein-tyrosine phosphatase